MVPKFDHSKDKLFKACGISPDLYFEIKQFHQNNLVTPTFNIPSEYIEYYWNRLPEKLKEEPFVMFYLGLAVGDMLRSKQNLENIVMN